MTRSDLDDRDSDQQWSQSEKQQILNDARATLARRDDQEIPRRDGDLDEQRTSFSDEERDKILKTARALVAGYDDEKFEIGEGDRKQRAFSPNEKAKILRDARDTLRRDPTTGLVKKVTYNAPAARQADAASEAHQPRQRRQWRRLAEASADDADFDPIDTGWPDPAKESKLDTSLEGLVADHVRTLFAEQHRYIFEVMAQVLADSVETDGVTGQALERERRQHRRDVRQLQAQIENLQHALGELRDEIAAERTRTLSLPPLPARSDLN